MSDNYEDIIYNKHHVSKNHKQMSLNKRAAQFAPFSALTGYEDAIQEVNRLTEDKIELSEDSKEEINKKLLKHINQKEKNKIEIIYFQKDDKKNGGKYKSITGIIKTFDSITREINLYDGAKINIENVIKIKDCF